MDPDRRPTSHYFYLGYFSFLFSFAVFITEVQLAYNMMLAPWLLLMYCLYLGKGRLHSFGRCWNNDAAKWCREAQSRQPREGTCVSS